MFSRLGVLRVPLGTPPRPSGRKPQWAQHLAGLATKLHTECWLSTNLQTEHRRAGLYVHIPFCRSVCPYCDFSVTLAGEQRREEFLDALQCEAGLAGSQAWPEFDTLYLGGGTPSQLAQDQLARLVGDLSESLSVVPDAWLSLEANPEDVTPEKAHSWRELGFNTVSLGAQSFDDDILRFLGRSHSAEQAVRAVGVLREAGFHTIAVDLIYGIDGLDPARWQQQLEIAVGLDIDHLSCYELTVHPMTVFGKRRGRGDFVEMGDEEKADLFFLTHRLLADLGLPAYEVSNFARSEEHRSRHNRKYWRHQPYLGLGPSAHSFRGRRRWWNQRKLRLWTAALKGGDSPIQGDEELSPTQLAEEAVMLGLRLFEGVDLERVEERFGVDLCQSSEESVCRMVEQGKLVVSGTRVRPTLEGLAVADSLSQLFVPVERDSTAAASNPYQEQGGSDV